MRRKITTSTLLAILAAILLLSNVAAAAEPIRVVVLPFYSEEGGYVKDGGEPTYHYRRMMRFINNQLVRHGFEVINPFAHDASEREYNRTMMRAREDSPLAALEVCKKYAADAAYLTWLKVKMTKTEDGYCKASARLEGEGYDSAGRDLGVGLSKTFKITREDCDDAIAEVEKEVGDLVGRKLTAWSGAPQYAGGGAQGSVGASPQSGVQGGALARNFRQNESLLSVKVHMVTDPAVAEVFGKVINTARGVLSAKLYGSRIVPDDPQASFINWRVTIDQNQTEPFRLQANILKMINDISAAGGKITLNGVTYRYSTGEIDLLKGLRTGDTSAQEIQFIMDRELARDREFSGYNDPYKSQQRTMHFD